MSKKPNTSSKRADIILVGGGSGGHLTPLVPIAEQLHVLDPSLRIAHIGQRNDPLNSIVKSSDISQYYEISAGKLRRYYGDNMLRRLLNVKDNLLNLRDFFRLIAGTYQSWKLLGQLKPKAMLAKGGYVGVPVGTAARLRKVPYITHDSDAQVSLANKLIAKGATYHTTAQDPKNYASYDQDKTVKVGVPVRSEFKKVTPQDMKESKKKLGYDKDSKMVLVLGGGLGARAVNDAVTSIANGLLSGDHKLHIVHITGKKLLTETDESYINHVDSSLRDRVRTIAFSDSLYSLSAAADVVVTRAGATNMAEFSAQAKACIVIPNPALTGGHQSKNAELYESKKAAIVVSEDRIKEELAPAILELIKSKTNQNSLGNELYSMHIPDASSKIASILIEIAG